jgi:hypothetical protein
MARRHVYDPLEATTERRWYVVKNMHELPPGIDLKREFILAMLGCIDAGWSIEVRVPFLPEVAAVIIQRREFIDLRERPLPQFRAVACLRHNPAQSMGCECVCGVAAEKPLLLTRKVRNPPKGSLSSPTRIPPGCRIRASSSACR